MLGIIRETPVDRGAMFWWKMWRSTISAHLGDGFILFTLPCRAADYVSLPGAITGRHMEKVSSALVSCQKVISPFDSIEKLLPKGVRLTRYSGERARMAALDKIVRRLAKELCIDLSSTEIMIYSAGNCYEVLSRIAGLVRFAALCTNEADPWKTLEDLCEDTGLTVRLAGGEERPTIAIIAPDGAALAPRGLAERHPVIDLSPNGPAHSVRFLLPSPYNRPAEFLTPDECLVEAVADTYAKGDIDAVLANARVSSFQSL